jgi:aspartokinase
VPGKDRHHAVDLLKQKCLSENIDFIGATYPVGLVCFHGPHYGDRYGIAETVFKTLDGKVKIIASSFSGAAVYLVFHMDDIKTAISLLSQTFETPDSGHE